jgi:signal transduction histidine kinase
MPKDIHAQYSWMSGFIFNSVLFLAAVFLSYPAWPARFKSENIMAIVWNIGSIYVMIFTSSLLIIMSNFGQLPMMIFMINLIVIAALMRWQTAVLMLVIGIYSAITFFKWQTGVATLPNSNIGLQFKFIYGLLLVTSSLIMFFKPKQEREELAEEKIDHLSDRIGSQEKQLKEALALRGEFIRNVTHEYHAPMTGITSMAQTLFEAYNKLTDEQRRSAAEIIFKSSSRLESFDANIATLSKLSKAGYELKLEPVDLSELLYNRIEVCRKLYEENKEDREFILNIEGDIKINCDKYYVTQALDNLIINAITYCLKGKITVTLKHNENEVICTIQDEGIGIPVNELEDIFAEFTVSSKTHTHAGGRGVGLALCKKVIEVHQGSISAESDGKQGAIFKIKLTRIEN